MKHKSDFKELKFINPFDKDHFNKMVYPDWAHQDKFVKWRYENSTFLEDPKYIDLLDIDELITQWNVHPEKRKANPKTCLMIYKELAIVIRMIDGEHQDAIFRESIPGVVKSSREDKYIFMKYNLEEKNIKKATSIEKFDTEEEAYWEYQMNRNSMIQSMAAKALSAKLIDPNVYEKYFSDENTISVRDISYYKNKEYKEE